MRTAADLSFLRDKRTQRVWILLVIAWVCIRAIVVKEVFGSYGVNAVAYFLVDLFSGIPYAIYSAKLVVNFLDKEWTGAKKNGFLTAIFFYIPDVFILITARQVPSSLLVAFLISVVIFTSFAVVGMRKDVTKGKK